ncbi:MAG: hypothetical protein QHJ34_03855 [bacterium]|jgi:hypothetical protein|nr:hypothetical protein [candidate division KSB1 bacterium]MDH7559350.1 hypothetical protein [bacterium]
MRIDFVVDSFANYEQLGPAQSAKGERFRTYGPKGAPARQEPPPAETDQVRLSEQRPTPPSAPLEQEISSVLDPEEQEMLGRLFPPGLFGSGVRAYKLAQGEVSSPLGRHVDTRS